MPKVQIPRINDFIPSPMITMLGIIRHCTNKEEIRVHKDGSETRTIKNNHFCIAANYPKDSLYVDQIDFIDYTSKAEDQQIQHIYFTRDFNKRIDSIILNDEMRMTFDYDVKDRLTMVTKAIKDEETDNLCDSDAFQFIYNEYGFVEQIRKDNIKIVFSEYTRNGIARRGEIIEPSGKVINAFRSWLLFGERFEYLKLKNGIKILMNLKKDNITWSNNMKAAKSVDVFGIEHIHAKIIRN